MSDGSLSRRLAGEADFTLGRMTVSPSTGRVFADGEEIRVEALTLAVLVTLVRAAGATVTRDALVEECWQGRIVSDDAVARAIAKVRALERGATPAAFTIETVPKIGYRLLVASDAEAKPSAPRPPAASLRKPFAWPSPRVGVLAAAAATAGTLLVVALIALIPRPTAQALAPTSLPPRGGDEYGASRTPRAVDVSDALLVLDEQRLRLYIRQGWNPNWKLDSEGNAALHNLMMACERNRSHDREGLVRVARLLVEAGEDPTAPNKWKDTPLIIAATPRYCGPDHPVVTYLKAEIAKRAAKRG